MTVEILTQFEQIVKWVVPIDDTTDLTGIPDGVYPYNGLVDQWAVVVDERAVNWSCTYGVICLMHAEIMRVKREHVGRNPANDLGKWWTVRTADYTASVDRETNEVSYAD